MKTFEEVRILESRFHKITVTELIDYLVETAQLKKKTIVANVNVRAMNFCHDLSWYTDFFDKADVVVCDGFGILLGARLLGHSVKCAHRMTPPDYIEDLVLACEKNNVSLFFLGGQVGIVDNAINNFLEIAPKLKIQGHPGHFEISGEENDAVIQQINTFKPDILYVGFGMPLQERWILDNLDRVEARVFINLGACLDFYTKTIYRGPRWLTDYGFEWLTRLLTEPYRLWKRYLIGNPLFLYRVLKQCFLKKTSF
jgi:N-acetylglucosaminyldiphosphoundecaprenol N-acetyl-beta-D-mannosaminyltransferase